MSVCLYSTWYVVYHVLHVLTPLSSLSFSLPPSLLQECNQVSPRDFCLAVSVLLDGDDVVLTKSEWAEIIDHFAQLGQGMSGQSGEQRQRATDFLGGSSVDYMLFCETVLDPNEIKSRLYETQAHDKAAKLDRSKQFLSKPASAARGRTVDSSSPRANSTAGRGYRTEEHVNTTGRMGMGVQGVNFSQSQPQSRTAHLTNVVPNKRDDEILKRFQAASQQGQGQKPAYSSGGGSKGYNSSGGAAAPLGEAFDRHDPSNHNIAKSSSTAAKSDWNTDDLYRVARTQGQASRESVRVGRDSVSVRDPSATSKPPAHMVVGLGHSKSASAPQSSTQNYASSHRSRGSSQSRLKWG
jgi:hypothetical protein